MNIIELFLVSLALAIDCFAISLCITSVTKIRAWKYLSIPFHFAAFHVIMIFLGYTIGVFFKTFIEGFDHWIAFVLLTGVGIKIIVESLEKENKKIPDLSTEWKVLVFSLATSIDALIIGLTFSFTSVALYPSTLIVGLTVLVISLIGLSIGRKLNGFKIKYLDVLAGAVLVSLGLKILVSHVFY